MLRPPLGFFGYGDGTFVPAINLGFGCVPSFVVSGDFTGDKKPDLTFVIPRKNDVAISVNQAK